MVGVHEITTLLFRARMSGILRAVHKTKIRRDWMGPPIVAMLFFFFLDKDAEKQNEVCCIGGPMLASYTCIISSRLVRFVQACIW